MKKYIAFIFILLLLFCLPTFCVAQNFTVPEDIEITGESIFVMNYDTGQPVIEINADAQRDIASLTKIMTALIFIENVEDLDNTLITAPTELYVAPITNSSSSTADIRPNETVTARSLLYAIMLPSGNEAAAIAAHYVGGGSLENFYAMMNARAKEIGCTNTNFTNPHGLDGMDTGNYSSARDLALICNEAWQYDIFRQVVGSVSYDMPITNIHTTPAYADDPNTAYTIYNTNYMLRDTSEVYRSYIQGIKTGSTYAAGRTLASAAVNDNGETYFAIVLGAPWDAGHYGLAFSFWDTAAIFDWLFDNFSMQSTLNTTAPITEISVELSSDVDVVALMPKDDLQTILPTPGSEYAQSVEAAVEQIIAQAEQSEVSSQAQSEQSSEEAGEAQEPSLQLPDTIIYEFDVPKSLTAPVTQGEVVGSVSLTLNGTVLGTVDLITANDVARSDYLYFLSLVGDFLNSTYFSVVIILTAIYIVLMIALFIFLRYLKKKRKKKRKAGNYTAEEWRSLQAKRPDENWTAYKEIDRLPPEMRRTPSSRRHYKGKDQPPRQSTQQRRPPNENGNNKPN